MFGDKQLISQGHAEESGSRVGSQLCEIGIDKSGENHM